jgi:hypothetical protein
MWQTVWINSTTNWTWCWIDTKPTSMRMLSGTGNYAKDCSIGDLIEWFEDFWESPHHWFHSNEIALRYEYKSPFSQKCNETLCCSFIQHIGSFAKVDRRAESPNGEALNDEHLAQWLEAMIVSGGFPCSDPPRSWNLSDSNGGENAEGIRPMHQCWSSFKKWDCQMIKAMLRAIRRKNQWVHEWSERVNACSIVQLP